MTARMGSAANWTKAIHPQCAATRTHPSQGPLALFALIEVRPASSRAKRRSAGVNMVIVIAAAGRDDSAGLGQSVGERADRDAHASRCHSRSSLAANTAAWVRRSSPSLASTLDT